MDQVSKNDGGADCPSLSSLPWELQLQGMLADGYTYQSMVSYLLFLIFSFLMQSNKWNPCIGDFLQNPLKLGLDISDEEKVDHSKILLKTVLPFLKQFNEEQIMEKEFEAKIQGILSFHLCI